MNSLFTKGLCIDLRSVEGLNLDDQYFSPDANDAFYAGDSQYFVTGRFSFSFYRSVFFTFFNAEMFEDNNINSLYDAVFEGNWDLEMLKEISKNMYSDDNGNDLMDENDSYGLCLNKSDADLVSNLLDISFVGKNNDNLFEYKLNSSQLKEKANTNLDYFRGILSNNSVYLYQTASNPFLKGKTGITLTTYKKLGLPQNIDFEYGILPLPKFSQDEADYSGFADFSMPMFGITSKEKGNDLDEMAIFLNVYAYISDIIFHEAFYDFALGNYKNNQQLNKYSCLDLAVNNFNLDPIFFINSNMRMLLKSAYYEGSIFPSLLCAIEYSNMVMVAEYNKRFK